VVQSSVLPFSEIWRTGPGPGPPKKGVQDRTGPDLKTLSTRGYLWGICLSSVGRGGGSNRRISRYDAAGVGAEWAAGACCQGISSSLARIWGESVTSSSTDSLITSAVVCKLLLASSTTLVSMSAISLLVCVASWISCIASFRRRTWFSKSASCVASKLGEWAVGGVKEGGGGGGGGGDVASRMIATARNASAVTAETPGAVKVKLSNTRLSEEWSGSWLCVTSRCSARNLSACSLVFMDVENLGELSRSSLVLPVASLPYAAVWHLV